MTFFIHFKMRRVGLFLFLGKCKGHSITKWSGVYESTITNVDTVVLHEMGNNGQLIKVFYNLITQVTYA